jgi:hypothetical protein
MDRIYTLTYEHVLLPNTGFGDTFELDNANRQFKLKTISFDLSIRLTGAGGFPVENVPLELNRMITYSLSVRTVGIVMSNVFNIAPAAGMENGSLIRITKPGIKKFDSGFAANTMRFVCEAWNRDLLLDHSVWYNVICEIEEL